MGNQSSLDHAKHNEKVCKYLDRKPEFTDWVITTAFYSAYHYLMYYIFPLTKFIGKNQTVYNTFNEYCIYESSRGASFGKHQTFAELVNGELPEVGPSYKQLMDISWTARYNDYQHSREVSNLAKTKLQKIKIECTKRKKP